MSLVVLIALAAACGPRPGPALAPDGGGASPLAGPTMDLVQPGEDTGDVRDTAVPPDTGDPPQPDTGDTGDAWIPASSLADLLSRVYEGRVDPRDLPALEALVADLASHDGPWTHAIHAATSSDGVAWNVEPGPIWERASMPEAFLDPEGRICVLAVDGDLDRFLARAAANDPVFRARGLAGVAGLAMRCCADGLALGPEEPLAVDAIPPVAVDPDVVSLPDGSLDLLYVGADTEAVGHLDEDGATQAGTGPRVARSRDGTTFEAHAATGLAPAFLDPTHAPEGDGAWTVLWNGLRSARSVDDERTWTVTEAPPPIEGTAPDLAARDDGTWLYHQCAHEPSVCLARPGPDGTWLPEPEPLVTHARGPSVVRLPDGRWWMVFVKDDGP